MSKRLTRAQREAIIIDYLNHKETPGYKVIEGLNGKFTVRAIKDETKPVIEQPKFELEEEDVNERECETQSSSQWQTKGEAQIYDDNASDDDYESLKQPPKQRSKQNARELLQQLSQLLNDEDNEQPDQQGQYIEKRYKPGPQSWRRKKLVL